MTEEEFINNATRMLQEDFNMTEDKAEAVAKLTVILEKNNLQREFFDSITTINKNDLGASNQHSFSNSKAHTIYSIS